VKILLTGATGFIGSHVLRRLIAEEHEVYSLIRPSSNTWRIGNLSHSLKIVPCDLFSTMELEKWLKEVLPELCIHLAWFAEPGKYLNSLENPRFLSGSIELATQLASLGCRRLVGVGTCFEYNTDLGYLSETSLTKPRTLYAASKLAVQLVLEQLGKVTGMEVAWVRLFYQYGPFEDGRRLVPSVICSLLRNEEVKVTKGEQVRDFLHVEDVASAIWAVAESNLLGPINIGSAESVTVRDVVTRIGRILERPELIMLGALPYGSFDPMFICANNHRLCQNTKWQPHFDLESGLRQTISWWRDRMES
jgi:nucleoside-diphosphate-sugar epimerase